MKRSRRSLAFLFIALASSGCEETPSERPNADDGGSGNRPGARLVSLSPAVTETLTALGAEKLLVATSDYCPRTGLPTVGSALTPNYEAIARLAPSQILMTSVGGAQTEPLGRLAPVVDLPWLTLGEVAASTEALGRLSGQEAAARALARRYQEVLGKRPSPEAKRVLLLIGSLADSGSDYWYVKRTSLHGALLHAAGYRNAVDRDEVGAPRLSVEEVVRLDPDAILLLVDGVPSSETERPLAPLRQLRPLAANREDRVRALARPNILSMGPPLLDVAAAVETTLDQVFREEGDAEGSR